MSKSKAKDARGTGGVQGAPPTTPPEYVSGPHTHMNLGVFLIRGKDRISTSQLLTLQEAMEQRLVVVHETGRVGELLVENHSEEHTVYLQAGDLVKGGRQDRALRYDLLLPPRSGRVALNCYCVEEKRWGDRGKESTEMFSGSSSTLPSTALRRAVAGSEDQRKVWRRVQETQERMSGGVGERVNAPDADTSLQRALEHPRLRGTIGEYTSALVGLPEGRDDVIGCAFAVDGEIRSADTYGAGVLFRKLWPKLLEAAAAEAIAERSKSPSPETPSSAELHRFLSEIETGKACDRDIEPRTRVVTRETKMGILLESRDKKQDEWVHRTYLQKGEEPMVRRRNDDEQISWVLERRLARSSRPGYASPRVLPEVVDRWLDEAVQKGIKSIICLLEAWELAWYPGVDLLERYRERGFEVRSVPIPDTPGKPPSQGQLPPVWEAFQGLPKPVLVHCSAGQDRTGAAVQLIRQKLGE